VIVTEVQTVWLEGWNAGVVAACSILEASDLPTDFADRAIDLLRDLLEEER